MDNGIKSFQHQIDVFERSKDSKAFALFLETGTGKTKIAIDTMFYLYRTGKIEAVVVIAPKAVYKKVWIEQLEKFKPDDVDYITMYWSASRTFSMDEQLRAYVNRLFDVNRLSFFLINVEAFSYKPIENYVRTFLTKYKCAIIIDESTRIKNPSANRTKRILQVSLYSHYRRIMSGFPVLNSPTDLYTQLLFLGSNLVPFASHYAFRNFYSILRQIDRRISIEIGHRNLEHLAKVIEPFSVRILKKDCLDLPDKMYEQRYVEMGTEQTVLYRSMRDQAFAELSKSEIVVAVNLMTQLGKLHQIANGILLGAMGISRAVETEKDRVLLEILSDETSGPVAISANYTKNIEHIVTLIKTRFGPGSCGAIYGDTKDSSRDKYISDFQSGSLPYLVFNPSTVREGIDLFTSHTCIFYNNSFKLDHRLQFEDRFHRIGQVNKVTYIDLITEHTMEEKLLEKLQEKRNIGGAIFHEVEWKEWF